ncbi:MAG: cytochrome P450 [Pseudomonadota bacterium]
MALDQRADLVSTTAPATLGRTERPLPVGVNAPTEPLGLWQAYRTARRNVLELIPEQAYREMVLRGGRGAGWIMIQDPPWLEHVLKKREPNYPKSPVTKRIMRPREGDNLLTIEGAEWRWQHRAMTPMFQRRAIEAQLPAMAEAGIAASARLRAAATQAGTVDVYPEMVAATCDVICDVALSGRGALDRDAITDGITAFIRHVARVSILDMINAPKWIPRPGELMNRRAVRIDAMIDAIIAARREDGPSEPPDLLDMLIGAEDPQSKQRMDAVTLRNNLLAFIAAGHETTALALTWALYLIAFDTAHGGNVQERLAAEAAALTDRPFEGADIDATPYTRMVLNETLRLYPPAGFMTRSAREPDTIAGHEIPEGTTAILPIYAVHRHQTLWDDPFAFDPERFAAGTQALPHRYAFLPFGAGPRVCIGMQFALIEAQCILATLMAHVSVDLPAGFVPEPRMWFTLRPGTGMPLSLKPR